MGGIKIIADWHTHTRYSDGKGTVEANVKAAAEKGLREVAITDHGPRGVYIGVRRAEVYLKIKKEIIALQEQYPVRVLLGAEANVIDPGGSIDVPPEVIKELDILLVGLHPQIMAATVMQTLGWVLPNQLSRLYAPLRDKVREVNTRALVNAMYNNPVNVVTHPDLMMPVNLDRVARSAVDTGCAVEINAGHDYNKDEVVRAALDWGAVMVVNSDAHRPRSVGEVESGAALLERWHVPAGQVINAVEETTALPG